MKSRIAVFWTSLLLLTAGLSAQTKSPKWVPLVMETPKEVQMAAPLGPKAATDILHISLGIPYRDEAGMKQFVDNVSNPKSPIYRQFLTPEQIGQRFGISESDLKKVSDYLASQGMKIRLVAKNRLSILADSTVAQAQTAFNTIIQEYLPAGATRDASSVRFSYSTAPQVPASIRPFVNVIGGLENFMRPHHRAVLTPSQLRSLYSVAPVYSANFQGQGRTVAISNWDGYLLSNVPLEYGQYGLPTPPGGVGTNITVIPVDGVNGNGATAQGEGDVDIQCVLAAAPLCNLLIYDDANGNDLLGVVTQEAEDNKADIVTESYGWQAGTTTTYAQVHSIHLSMSAQGITYLCASGDTGTSGIAAYPYPDQDPEVLVVGGTSVTIDGNGNRLSEVAWNDGTNAGGGGWVADATPFNLLPAYQKGNGVPTTIPYRLFPDIALDADPATGYDIFIDSVLNPGVGGTSCASPTTAGALADCEQAIIAGGGLPANAAGKRRFGRIQDLLYSFNGDSSVFYDVVSGTIGTLPDGTNANAGPGWDPASGWGPLIFSGLVARVLGVPVPASLSVTPTSVVGGTTVTGTITVSLPAPKGGLTVTMSSDNSLATPPASVTVPAGATSVTFSVPTLGTTTVQTVNLTGTTSGGSVTCSLTLNPSGITGVSITPTSVAGGDYATGTVTLNGPAPAGGFDVSLTSSSSVAMVPQHVEIAEGLSSDTFSIATNGVTSLSTATITATYGGISASATITISPFTFNGFMVSPSSVTGGSTSVGTVMLGGVAPANGLTIKLSSNNPAASIPDTVAIPAGASSATVTINTNSVTASTAVTLTASYSGTTFTAPLTVLPNTVAAVSVSPTSVTGGTSSIGTVTLTGPAASGGLTINLSSNAGNATVPASISIPAGATSGTFTILTSVVSTSVSATISASQGGNTATATLSVLPSTVFSLTVAPNSVGGGSSAVGTVTLSGAAGPTGAVISLSSSSPAASVPASVTILAGKTSATFNISTSSVGSSTVVTLTASQGVNQQTATLTINPAALASVSVSPSSVTGGNGATGTVTLTGTAPSGGMVVALASTNPAVTVPATVTVSSGAISATFGISTTAVATSVTVTITGTQAASTASANLTVLSPLLASVSVMPSSVVGGNGVTGTVNLARPAPTGGATVSLAANSLLVGFPASVTVAGGALSANFNVSTTGVTTTASIKLTASLSGTSTSATLVLEPTGLLSISVAPNPVVGGADAVGTVTLDGMAPVGGFTVQLSSNSVDAPIQGLLSIPGGSMSATFPVTSKAVTKAVTATITATLGDSTLTTQVAIQPAAVSAITLSKASIISGSNVIVSGTVTVDATAGRSGDVVSLKSSNPSVLVVPSSVKVLNGATTAAFTLRHLQVASPQTVTVTATFGGTSVSTTIDLDPFLITSFAISPTSVVGGTSATALVTLNAIPGAQNGPIVVKIASSAKSIGFASALSIPVGVSSGKLTITTKAVSALTSASIIATHGNSSQAASLTIQPAGLLSVSVSPSTLKGSSKTVVTGTVLLSGPAAATGAVITVSSSNTTAASVPTTVLIPAGKTSVTFKVTHSAVTNQTTVTLSATFTGVTKTTSLTVTP